MWESILLSSLSALLLVLALDVPFLRIGINLADEGYLYFGSRQVLKGKVPIIDFRSYDPGRYYWCALWLGIFGESLWIQRLSMSFLKWITLAIIGFLCLEVSDSWLIVVAIQISCLGWLFIYYKMVECLFIATQLLSFWMVLQYGNDLAFASVAFLLSFSLILGINMTVYHGGAVVLFFVLSRISMLTVPLNPVVFGLLVGALPLFIIIVRYPHFIKHYWARKISPMLKRKSTNLKLPYPWVWRNPSHITQSTRARTFTAKLLFTLIPIFFILVGFSFRFGAFESSANAPLIIPALVVGIPWLNHIISRADIGHLHIIGLPLSLLLLNTSSIHFTGAIILAICIAWMTLSTWFFRPSFTTKYFQPVLKKLRFENRRFWMTRNQKVVIAEIVNLVGMRGDKTTFFAPNLCMLYALTNTQPAAYDTFPVYPATDSKQAEMIHELSTSLPTLVVINNFQLDQNADRCFSATHPKVWDYLQNEFQTVQTEKLPSTYFVFSK